MSADTSVNQISSYYNINCNNCNEPYRQERHSNIFDTYRSVQMVSHWDQYNPVVYMESSTSTDLRIRFHTLHNHLKISTHNHSIYNEFLTTSKHLNRDLVLPHHDSSGTQNINHILHSIIQQKKHDEGIQELTFRIETDK